MSELRADGHRVRLPLDDLSSGKRLQKLIELNDEDQLNRTYREFYKIIRDLYIGQSGGRLLKDTSGKLEWPKRGLYFFFEPHELLTTHSYSPLSQRITRVGTHAVSKGSRTTLWDRLGTHRGGNHGAGSHRSSIFRLHVGAALARKDPSLRVDTWGIGSVGTVQARQAELHTEREVSNYIGETRLLWLDVRDEAGPYSDRAFLERNAIGLLSRQIVLQGPLTRNGSVLTVPTSTSH
jgi:hypothetical protein